MAQLAAESSEILVFLLSIYYSDEFELSAAQPLDSVLRQAHLFILHVAVLFDGGCVFVCVGEGGG